MTGQADWGIARPCRMILIHEAGQGNVFDVYSITSHSQHDALLQTGRAEQTAGPKRTVSARQIAWQKQPVAANEAVRRLAGFTLLELMIVITIISILVGIAAGA